MIYLGFMLGTAFGIILVAILGGNKRDDTDYNLRKTYDAGYDKGYADGMSDGYSIKK